MQFSLSPLLPYPLNVPPINSQTQEAPPPPMYLFRKGQTTHRYQQSRAYQIAIRLNIPHVLRLCNITNPL